MISDCKTTNDEYKEQKKTQKETDNWVTTEEIKEKFDEMKKRIDAMIDAKMIHHTSFIDFLLFALLSGVYIPPRRSLDYALLKVRNYDENTDNFLKKGVMYFNQYKTAKKYGLQKVKLPKELLDYIKVWIKNTKNDYLFFGRTDNHLTSPQICKILNNIFGGKHISVDMLRHIYLTNYYKDIPKLTEMSQLAAEMGNSIATQLHQYVKKD
jgi:integrase